MASGARSVGIDVGAAAVHAVVLADDAGTCPTVAATRLVPAVALADLVALASGAGAVAIDAPSDISTAPHRDDGALSRKFRTARCGEIALGEDRRIWVPWVTPVDSTTVPGWMTTGFAAWTMLRTAGHTPIEVYPYGAFRVLAGGAVPNKATPAGVRRRLELLAEHVDLPLGIDMWSHDGIDALVAALVARWSIDGRAQPHTHTANNCDGSAIWLPAR